MAQFSLIHTYRRILSDVGQHADSLNRCVSGNVSIFLALDAHHLPDPSLKLINYSHKLPHMFDIC